MKSAFTPFFLVILAIIGFFYYIQPGYTQIQTLQREIEQYNTALAKAKEFEKKRDDLVAQLNNFKTSDLERLQKMIPDGIDSTRLVIEIDEIAKRYTSGIRNIRISDFRQTGAQSEASANDPFNTVTIGFSMTGSYENFIRFLEELEANLRLTDVHIVGLTPGQAANDYSYDVTVKTYWLKPVQ